MRDGIYIRAGIVRLVVLGFLALVGLAVVEQYPDLRRYIKSEMM